MKNLLSFLLLPLLALQACHKKETERTYFPLNKYYQVWYHKDKDSLNCSASFSNNYGYVYLDQNQSVTLNDKGPDIVESSYVWTLKGKQDVVFKLNDRGTIYGNTVKADDMKIFEVVIPDTIYGY